MECENNSEINNFYKDKIASFGPSPKGVGWNGQKAQEIRFAKLCTLLPKNEFFTLVDLGCGYGELYKYIANNIHTNFHYIGIDINQDMIDTAKKYLPAQNVRLKLISNCKDLPHSDFSISSGTFNIKGNIAHDSWTQHVLSYLNRLNLTSKFGFAINFLTKYSDSDRKLEDHYYCDPCFIFDYIKNNICRNVSILHDYDLYDFTVIVKKDEYLNTFEQI